MIDDACLHVGAQINTRIDLLEDVFQLVDLLESCFFHCLTILAIDFLLLEIAIIAQGDVVGRFAKDCDFILVLAGLYLDCFVDHIYF